MKTPYLKAFIAFLLFTFSVTLQAQDYDGNYRKKVKTLDSTIETLYGVISGDAGERRDWKLFKYLFTDNALLVPIGKDSNGRAVPRFMTPEDYVERSGPFLVKNGFFEKEVARRTESYGALTHVFSTYESFRSSKETEPFARGINSIQLINDGQRWWIVNITWQGETEEFPLPDKYLEGE